MTGLIRVLPMWQPWGSLLLSGAKRIETRAYPPSRLGLQPGQRIALHAAKRTTELDVCDRWPFDQHIVDPASLPLGAIIGTATLVRATQMTAEAIAQLELTHPIEREFGSYEPGRWAWVISDPQPLTEPVSYLGRQGAFDVPLELLGLTVRDVPHAAPVYVDSFDDSPLMVPPKWAGGGHLTADTPEALHLMAGRLGLKREWFQTKPGRPWHDHYDLTRSKRERALQLGATPITWRQAAQQSIAARRELAAAA